jgi:hypothetical protein
MKYLKLNHVIVICNYTIIKVIILPFFCIKTDCDSIAKFNKILKITFNLVNNFWWIYWNKEAENKKPL